MKAEPNETPIDVQSIVDFMDHFDMQPKTIRNTVEKLSWKNQMQQLLDQCEDIRNNN
jgi:hypothetical protein